MSDGLAFGIAALAIAALSVGVAFWRSGRAEKVARRANDIAAQAVAEARRSADAAEEAVKIQGAEALAVEDERRRQAQANVVPLKWEPSARASLRGLQLKNFGPGVARQVMGEIRMGESSFRRGTVAAISPHETVGLTTQLQDFQPEDPNRVPVPRSGEAAARAVWVNEDESPGETDWRIIPATYT